MNKRNYCTFCHRIVHETWQASTIHYRSQNEKVGVGMCFFCLGEAADDLIPDLPPLFAVQVAQLGARVLMNAAKLAVKGWMKR
jgi:hypothetical protein